MLPILLFAVDLVVGLFDAAAVAAHSPRKVTGFYSEEAVRRRAADVEVVAFVEPDADVAAGEERPRWAASWDSLAVPRDGKALLAAFPTTRRTDNHWADKGLRRKKTGPRNRKRRKRKEESRAPDSER